MKMTWWKWAPVAVLGIPLALLLVVASLHQPRETRAPSYVGADENAFGPKEIWDSSSPFSGLLPSRHHRGDRDRGRQAAVFRPPDPPLHLDGGAVRAGTHGGDERAWILERPQGGRAGFLVHGGGHPGRNVQAVPDLRALGAPARRRLEAREPGPASQGRRPLDNGNTGFSGTSCGCL